MTVGLVVPDILNYFYAAGAGVLQATLEQHGYRLIICISNDDPRSDGGYLTALLEEQVDGIVHVPCTPEGARAVRELGQGVPVVELNRTSDYGQFDAVLSDDREGSYQLGRHLLDLGHRHVGVLAGPPAYSTTRSRLAGFRQAFLEAGIGDEGLEVRHGQYSLEWGAQGTGELLAMAPQPTALFATGNSIVLGALRALTSTGMQVPEDISLIGFDDPAWCSVWRPAITTYALPLRDMGLLAAQLLVSRMRSGGAESMPSVTRVSGRLMLRGSTGVPHTGRNGVGRGKTKRGDGGDRRSAKYPPTGAQEASSRRGHGVSYGVDDPMAGGTM
jgi:LacI family transcriptional regulator